MRRSTERTLVVLLLLVSGVYAIAEEVTLTTYYPSPRGVYDQLRTMAQTILAQNSGSVGVGTDTPDAASKLEVHGNTNIVVPAGSAAEGLHLYQDSVAAANLLAAVQLDGATNGIGTFYPGTGQPAAAFTAQAGVANIQMCDSADTAAANCTGGAGAGDWTFNLSQNGALETRGNVSIGMMTPSPDNYPLTVIASLLGNGIAIRGRNIGGVPFLPPFESGMKIDVPLNFLFNYGRIQVLPPGGLNPGTLGLQPSGGKINIGSAGNTDASITNVYGELWDYDLDPGATTKGAVSLRNGDLQIYDNQSPRQLRAAVVMNNVNAAQFINYASGETMGGLIAGGGGLGFFAICPQVGDNVQDFCDSARSKFYIDAPSGNVTIKGSLEYTGSAGSAGDVLTTDGSGHATWEAPAGGGGAVVTRNNAAASAQANCAAGKHLTGGGCLFNATAGSWQDNHPIPNGASPPVSWWCQDTGSSNTTAYAICE